MGSTRPLVCETSHDIVYVYMLRIYGMGMRNEFSFSRWLMGLQRLQVISATSTSQLSCSHLEQLVRLLFIHTSVDDRPLMRGPKRSCLESAWKTP